MNKSSVSRNSGIELLRILSIMMVSTVHFLGNGILYKVPFSSSDFNTVAARGIESLAIVCINVFILIAGYFGITSKGLNVRRLLDMLLMIAFFSGTAYIINSVSINEFDFPAFIKSLFPYMVEGYWFVRVYLILSVITPFLNIGLTKLNKTGYSALLIIFLIVFSVLPSFNKAFANTGGLDIIHFVVIYCIGGYLRLHIHKMPSSWICFAGYLFFAVLTFLFSIFGDGLGYWAYDFVTVIPESCLLFLTFVQFKFKSRFINYIAKSSLAIFVLENSIGYIFGNIYINIMKVEKYMQSPYFLLHFIICIFGFTTFAIAADCLRRLIFKYTVNKLIDKIKPFNIRALTNIEN